MRGIITLRRKMSADIGCVQSGRRSRVSREMVCENGNVSNLTTNGTLNASDAMVQQLQKPENGEQSTSGEPKSSVDGAQIAAKKPNRKRKSYYMNEMVRLGIDPANSGDAVNESERENVFDDFKPINEQNTRSRRIRNQDNSHLQECHANNDNKQTSKATFTSKCDIAAVSQPLSDKCLDHINGNSPIADVKQLTNGSVNVVPNGKSNGYHSASNGHRSDEPAESTSMEVESPIRETESSNGVAVSIVSEQEEVKASRTRPNPFKLIRCEKYGENAEAPFQLFMSVEALTIIDVHAHCVQNEVIGLLGGKFCPLLSQLHIYTAVPCESLSDSTTDLQCEMDPVSQAVASEKLSSNGYNVVGWYHSHPTFLPNPSLRDLETQEKYQQLFAEGEQPFVAIILSPYSTSMNPTQKNSYVSKYKCLMVSDQQNSQGDYRIPYEFSPQLTRKDKLVINVLNSIKELCPKIAGQESTLCLSDKIKGREIQYIQKLTASLKHHLELTGLSNKECEHLLDHLKNILMDSEIGKAK